MYYYNTINIENFVGKTFTKVEKMNDAIRFVEKDGPEYIMMHQQDCCESVYIEDICGDLKDLENAQIVSAYESCENDRGPLNTYDESYTWTFYRISSTKGSVTLRWYGSSNGYYSESVNVYVNGKTQ